MLWLCRVNYVLGQQYSTHFSHLTVADGLSEAGVTSVVQDHSGFIWCATLEGLNRYDGFQFKVYWHDPSDSLSLSGDQIETLFVDIHGTLWIGTKGTGLDRYDHETDSFSHYVYDPQDSTSISSNRIDAIYEAPSEPGVLWIGTYNGLNRFDILTGTNTRYRHNPDDPLSLSNDEVRVIYEDSHGILWIGTGDPWGSTGGGGLNRLDRGTGTFKRYHHDPSNPRSLIDNRVQAIYEDSRGTLWIGTWGDGLHRFDRSRDQFERLRAGARNAGNLSAPYLRGDFDYIAPGPGVRFIHEERVHPGILWIGSHSGGLNRYNLNTGTLEHYEYVRNNPFSLISNNVWSVFEDTYGTLWITSLDGGINQLNLYAPRFIHYFHDPDNPGTISSDAIRALYEDEEGYLWIGTGNRGLDRMDLQSGDVLRFRHDPDDLSSLGADQVNVIFEDSKERLWLGTSAGLDRYDRITNRYDHFRHSDSDTLSIGEGSVVSIYEDREGTLWVGTMGGGLNRNDEQKEFFVRYQYDPNRPGSISNNNVLAIFEDRNGTLWIGTYGGGLNRFESETATFTNFLVTPGDASSSYISESWIYCLVEDSSGRFWVGTSSQGLLLFDRDTGESVAYTVADGLPGQSIRSILEDDAGKLWISTKNGLSRFDPEFGTFKNFAVGHVLPVREFYRGSSFKMRDGSMVFGGPGGFVSFDPGDIVDNTNVPDVVVTDIFAYNRSTATQEILLDHPYVSSKGAFSVPYGQNDITFEYAGLHYPDPAGIRYAYKLENYDSDWFDAGAQRYARYPQLPPGRYVFRVRASNADGYWNEDGTALQIRIVPPWWMTTWVYVLFLLLLVAGLVAAFGLQRHRLVRAQNAREAAAREINVELEKRVKDRTQALELANQELNAFAYMVAHDLKNPLSTMIMNVALLKEEIGSMTEETMKPFIDQLDRQGKQMDGIINELLILTGVRQKEVERTSLDMEAIVKSSILRLEYLIVHHKPEIIFPDTWPEVLGYGPWIEEVWANYISNAIQYGGTPPVVLLGASLQDENTVRYWVRDNGNGLSREQMDQLFIPFTRLEQAQTKGHGLGLSIVERIISKLEGTTHVESDGLPGKGCIFSFTLPRVRSSES